MTHSACRAVIAARSCVVFAAAAAMATANAIGGERVARHQPRQQRRAADMQRSPTSAAIASASCLEAALPAAYTTASSPLAGGGCRNASARLSTCTSFGDSVAATAQ